MTNISTVSAYSSLPAHWTTAPASPRRWGRFFWNFGAPQESIQGSRFRRPPMLYREKTPTGLAALVQRSVFRAGAVSTPRRKPAKANRIVRSCDLARIRRKSAQTAVLMRRIAKSTMGYFVGTARTKQEYRAAARYTCPESGMRLCGRQLP
jgi:hypothetical protein